ncbi:MAG: hypothetical protein U0736_10875 [Gemmataceae bacterium]
MPSDVRKDRPGSSQTRRPAERPNPAEDALAGPAPSTDDTPTIISRNTPAPPNITLED